MADDILLDQGRDPDTGDILENGMDLAGQPVKRQDMPQEPALRLGGVPLPPVPR
jgi:hypothetical protein